MDIQKKLRLYIQENLEYLQEEKNILYDEFNTFAYKKAVTTKSSVKDFINQAKEDSFSSYLFSLIDQKGWKDSDLYHKAHIDRRLFSKIRNENYHPSKETVIALGLALELTTSEFEKLLTKASFSLPKNTIFDLIIRFCIQEHIYNIMEVNQLLSEYSCPLLGNNEK